MEPNDYKEDSAYGFVAVYMDGDIRRYLLVRHVAGHWGFPKGHMEKTPAGKDETGLEAALRELKEECGIDSIEIVPGRTFTQTYTFDRAGETYHKTNTFFLGRVASMEARPQPEEIVECRFLTLEEAQQMELPENILAVLKDAERVLKSEA